MVFKFAKEIINFRKHGKATYYTNTDRTNPTKFLEFVILHFRRVINLIFALPSS